MPLSGTPVGGTGFSLTSVVVQDGGHVLESNQPVGVMVYGFGGPSGTGTVNVSYGYPAGLNLNPINPVE